MTVLDLIRRLKAKGKEVRAFDLYITCGSDIDGCIAEETNDDWYTIPYFNCEIPPECIVIDDHPDYLYVETQQEFIDMKLSKRVPLTFPRLFVSILREASYKLNKNWKGHMWSDIPEIELEYVPSDGGMIPEIDVEGRFTMVRDDTGFITGKPKPCYYLKDDRGFTWAWLGDVFKDKIPEGLHPFDMKKELGDRF